MSARCWLISLLSIWLILVLCRQVFDLVGRLWILVGFNLLQIVCCICGLFGAVQKRFSLLCVFSITTLFSIAENVLIMLWYFGLFGNRSRPVLAAGLPYSFSFFIRYTPGCEAHFDLNTSKWVQSSSCPVPYYYIEIAQAILHISIGFLSLILCTVLLCQRSKEKTASKAASTTYSHVNQRSLPIEAPSSINDASSGYMNSSYEEVNEIVRPDPLPPPPRTVPVRPNERTSKKKRGKQRPQSMPHPDMMNYSSAETDEIAISPVREDFYTKPQKKNASGRFKKVNENTRRATIHEELSVEGMLPSPPEMNGLARSASGNMTSLVSFDPKSGTLLRVREHMDSEDSDYKEYRRLKHERGVDVGSTYERIRPYADRCDIPTASQPLATAKNKNPSQDSVPSMIAPILTVTDGNLDRNEGDYGHWASRRLGTEPKSEMLYSPGIRLTQQRDYAHSPGIRLSTALAAQNNAYRSAFQVEPRETSRVIGHYHATNEFPLARDDEEIHNRAVISDGGSLLV